MREYPQRSAGIIPRRGVHLQLKELDDLNGPVKLSSSTDYGCRLDAAQAGRLLCQGGELPRDFRARRALRPHPNSRELGPYRPSVNCPVLPLGARERDLEPEPDQYGAGNAVHPAHRSGRAQPLTGQRRPGDHHR